jgi:hypothetical protein
MQGKSTLLPGEVCAASEKKGLRRPRGLLTAAQKSAEGIVPARGQVSAGKARTSKRGKYFEQFEGRAQKADFPG